MKRVKIRDELTGVEVRLPVVLTREQRMAILSLIATTTTNRPSDRIAALKAYAEMTGESVQVQDGGITTLKVIVEGAKPNA